MEEETFPPYVGPGFIVFDRSFVYVYACGWKVHLSHCSTYF